MHVHVLIQECLYMHVCMGGWRCMSTITILHGHKHTDEQSKLFHSEKVPKSFFANVLNELVSRSDCEPRHLQYLVCTRWSLKEFSAAKVSLKHVLSEIGVRELATVQRLMELGKPIYIHSLV